MAVRLDRNNPDLYFGRPGNLFKLPWPRGDMDKQYERPVFDFATGSGNHVVSNLASGSRVHTLTWNALHADTFAKLEQFWSGMMGTGPWALVDPSQSNMLQTNQASATSLFNDSRQFFTSGAANEGELTSNAVAAQTHRGPRSLRWRWPVAPSTTPFLLFTASYRSWYGYPCVPGLSYAFSTWLKADGTIDTSITAGIRIQWRDWTGATIGSSATSGDLTVTGWQRASAVGVAPAGAVFARPYIYAIGSSITVGGSLYVDEPLLEQDTVVNDWVPGTGLRPVEIIGLTDAVPFAGRFRKGVSMTIRELAP